MSALFALAAQGAGHLAALGLHLVPKPGPSSTGKPTLATSPTTVTRKVAMSVPQTRSEGTVTLAQGWWWGRGYNSDSRSRDQEPTRDWWRRSEDEDDRDESRPRAREHRGTYRTLCVRLCDGFYWPISYATTPEHFDNDRRKCESSCGSPVQLYKYSNPGGDLEDMEDLKGRPYSKLKTAFLYRTEYDASCKCKSDPWEQEATSRHRMYALEAAKRKGDTVAAKELDELKVTRETARRDAEAAARAAGAIAKVETNPRDAGQPSVTPPATSHPISRSSRERMSLGASSPPPSRPSGPPTRLWRDRADNAP